MQILYIACIFVGAMLGTTTSSPLGEEQKIRESAYGTQAIAASSATNPSSLTPTIEVTTKDDNGVLKTVGHAQTMKDPLRKEADVSYSTRSFITTTGAETNAEIVKPTGRSSPRDGKDFFYRVLIGSENSHSVLYYLSRGLEGLTRPYRQIAIAISKYILFGSNNDAPPLVKNMTSNHSEVEHILPEQTMKDLVAANGITDEMTKMDAEIVKPAHVPDIISRKVVDEHQDQKTCTNNIFSNGTLYRFLKFWFLYL